MARRIASLAVVVVVGVAAPLSAQLRSEMVVGALRNPVAVVADPTDASTLLIVEQRGVIRVARDGRLLEEPFLDVRDHVSTGGERGLLGLALAPDYAESRRFFVNFTDRNGDTVVARFLRHADAPHRADTATRHDLQWPDGRRRIEQPFSNHNGGHLAFGPDGYLYIGLGDGGSGGDPLHHAQRSDSLLGKMLRIDVDVPDSDVRGYRVPEDNPFLSHPRVSTFGEVWAFGLRNPWRYAFDDPARGGTSALLLADVGQNAREEINFEPARRGGRNYGWRLREGRLTHDERAPAAFTPLTEPIHDYGRATGASITGGLVYRGSALDPSYDGRYFFADFISGRVFSIGLHLDEHGEARAGDEREHTTALGGRTTLGMVSAFGQDHDGEMLVVNYSAGQIVRVVPDLAVVPGRPGLVALTVIDRRTSVQWRAAEGPVPAVEYLVEHLRNGAVIARVVSERQELTLEMHAGDCVRVRGVAGTGLAGPASAALCVPAA